MILKEVSIKNFKIIKENTFTLNDKFNLIIGKNGTGKTSILEAINIGLGGFFCDEHIRVEYHIDDDGSYEIQYHTPIMIKCTGDVDLLGDISWARSTVSNHINIPNKNKEGIYHITSYQSSDRISRQEDKKILESDYVKETICKFIKILENNDSIGNIFYDMENHELIYKDDEKSMPLKFMSGGYKSLIYMVANIAYEMLELNEHIRDEAIQKTTGIIMIDELDLHIHPRWQWNIIDALIEVFPSVQFIATTNSPIIIASCKDKNIISLSNNDTLKSPYGWSINDVLNQFMEAENIK